MKVWDIKRVRKQDDKPINPRLQIFIREVHLQHPLNGDYGFFDIIPIKTLKEIAELADLAWRKPF